MNSITCITEKRYDTAIKCEYVHRKKVEKTEFRIRTNVSTSKH